MKSAESRDKQNPQLNSKLDFGVTSTCLWLLKEKGCYWHCSRHIVYLWSIKCVLLCNRILTTNIFHRLKQTHPLISLLIYIYAKKKDMLLASPMVKSLRKHAYSNILKILPPKNEIFQIKNSDIFHISAQNIDCGYSLEPPRRGGSNEYPQSMFWAEIRKYCLPL